MKIANRTWLVSDTHFGHKNIIKFQQRPESHEVIMLSEWIDAVREDDDILHLGDVFMGKQGSPGRWASVVARLPGRKYLLLGNHDKAPRSLYERAGFTIIEPFIHRGVAFTHRPISREYPLDHEKRSARATYVLGSVTEPGHGWHTNVHGHTHGNVVAPSSDPTDHDGHLIQGKTYINVCVERTAFKPIRLGSVCPLR